MMEKLREALGNRYDELRDHGAASLFFFERIGSLEKDDLLAVIGWLGKQSELDRVQRRREFNFMADLAKRA